MKQSQNHPHYVFTHWIALFFCLSLGTSVLFLQNHVSAKKVAVDEICQIPVVIQAEVPEKIQKGKSFKLSKFILKPGNTYGVTIASSITELSATNTNSKKFNQDFYKTDPSPTTGADSYTAFYPDWVIDASGEVGSSIEIKLVGSISEVADVGPVPCKFTKTLATIPIVSEQVESAPIPADSSIPAVVAMRVKVLDSFGRPIKGTKISFAVREPLLEATTDENGLATFENVLSGRATLIVKDGEDRITQEVIIGSDSSYDKTMITFQKIAPPLYANPILIGFMAVILAMGILGSMIYVLWRSRKVKNAASSQPVGPGLTNLIGSSNFSNQPVRTIIPEPNQPYGTPQTYQPSPAPWTLPVAPDSFKQAVQPQQVAPTVNQKTSLPATPTSGMVSDILPPAKQTPQAPQLPENNPGTLPPNPISTTQTTTTTNVSNASAPQPPQQ